MLGWTKKFEYIFTIDIFSALYHFRNPVVYNKYIYARVCVCVCVYAFGSVPKSRFARTQHEIKPLFFKSSVYSQIFLAF